MDRKKELEKMIFDCCNSSSLFVHGKLPSVKLIAEKGIIIYFDNSRMLDYHENIISDFNLSVDGKIINDLMINSEVIMGCESHDYNGQGCYTFSIKPKKLIVNK